MTTAEFRELVDDVADRTASLRSAVAGESANETRRVKDAVRELAESAWPSRLSDYDRNRALRVMEMADAAVAELFDRV